RLDTYIVRRTSFRSARRVRRPGGAGDYRARRHLGLRLLGRGTALGIAVLVRSLQRLRLALQRAGEQRVQAEHDRAKRAHRARDGERVVLTPSPLALAEPDRQREPRRRERARAFLIASLDPRHRAAADEETQAAAVELAIEATGDVEGDAAACSGVQSAR